MGLAELTFVVLFFLCAGTFMSFGLLNAQEVGSRFYRIHGWGASTLCGLAFVLRGSDARLHGEALLWFYAYIFFSTVYYSLTHLPKFIYLPVFFLGTLSAIFSILIYLTALVSEGLYAAAVLNSVLSSFLLGFTMTAMLLGHWYLNQPKMSGDELKRVTVAFLGLVTVRFTVSTLGIWDVFSSASENEIYGSLGSTAGIFLLMRYVWGILGPLGLAYFIWGTVRIRSTQSATGILYVAVLFVLVGEIISQYLTFFHGVPL